MIGLAERSKHQDLHVMATMDTMPVIEQRIRNLLRWGRRITIVQSWIHGTDSGNPDVKVGLTIDTAAYQGGLRSHRGDDQHGFAVYLRPGLSGFSVHAYAHEDATEEDAWRRYHNEETRRSNLTRLIIDGGFDGDHGPRNDDQILIENWNENGVGQRTMIAFDPGPGYRERAESDAAVLDKLATLGSPPGVWTPESLAVLATSLRDWHETVADRVAWVANHKDGDTR